MRTILLLVVTLVTLSLTAAPANADLVLLLNDGATSSTDTLDWDEVIIDNQGSGQPTTTGVPGGNWISTVSDASADAGLVSFSGSVGSFMINMTTGISDPNVGPNVLNLTSFNISGHLDGGTLSIMVIDTDYEAPSGPTTLTFHGGGLTDGKIRMRSGYSASNEEDDFDFVTDTTKHGNAFSYSQTEGVNISGPFSMYMLVQITHDPGESTNFGATVHIPETASALLVLLGLAGVGIARRRKCA
jgi:hypothetical protein